MGKNNRGITLIALIVTIIILLILAGVAIVTLTGENGLLKRANDATEKSEMAAAKEKIELTIIEYKMKSMQEGKEPTIDGLEEFLKSNNEINIEKESDTSATLTTDGYSFIINEDLAIIETIGILKKAKTEISYIVNETSGNTMKVTIIVSNANGITKVTTPKGDEITPTDESKNKIEIEYEIVSGQEYIFKIQEAGEADSKEYVLKADINTKPEIKEDTNNLAYPVLTYNGVITDISKTIVIDYGDSTENNYYSLDEGKTWKKYVDPISVNKKCKIMAKSINENAISKIVTKDIIVPEDNSIGPEAYDGDESTLFPGGNMKRTYMKIDSSVFGKKLKVLSAVGYHSVTFFNQAGKKLCFTDGRGLETTYEIPVDANLLCYYFNEGGGIYEMFIID